MSEFKWLKNIWKEFLPQETIKIGDEYFAVSDLKKIIRSFLNEKQATTQETSLEEIILFLIDKEYINDEYLTVKDYKISMYESEEDTTDSEPSESIYDDYQFYDDYQLSKKIELLQTLRNKTKENLIQFLEVHLGHRVEIITHNLIYIKKTKISLNPFKEITLNVKCYFKNLNLETEYSSSNFNLKSSNNYLVLTLARNIEIDEEFVGICQDNQKQFNYLINNFFYEIKEINFFIWSLLLLNSGFYKQHRYEISYYDEKNNVVIKEFYIDFEEDSSTEQININPEKLNLILKLMKLLDQYASSPKEKLHVSLERLESSLMRSNIQDILIDLVFSLETSILVEKEEEISHRLILFSTYVTSLNSVQISNDSLLIKNAYKARSDIAHGNADKIKDSLSKVNIIELFDLVRRVILSLLNLNDTLEFEHKKLREQILNDTVDLLYIFENIQNILVNESNIKEKINELIKMKKPKMLGIKKVS